MEGGGPLRRGALVSRPRRAPPYLPPQPQALVECDVDGNPVHGGPEDEHGRRDMVPLRHAADRGAP
jgi:hypothetical protein